VRVRLIVPVLLVLAATAAGFALARINANRDARRDAQHRADIAATEVSSGLEQATNLVESLRRLMLGEVRGDVTDADFAVVGARWLSPVGLPAAAWVEEPQPGSSTLRAALVTGASPMSAPEAELDNDELRAAVRESRTLSRVTATPLVGVRDGGTGIFLVQAAPREVSGGALEPGYIVLFVPGSWLFAEVTEETNPRLQVRVGNTSYGSVGRDAAVGSSFTAAGRKFEVLVPRNPLDGSAAALAWIVLTGGLVLAALAGGLAIFAARRRRAQREVDRFFALSPDLIAVADFDGVWKRANPAFQTLLGYTESEVVGRAWTDFIHPDDRERSEAETGRLLVGETTFAFENRMRSKDGSYKSIEWTATGALDDQVLYGVGRDVTDRRRSDSEEKALRRVATLAAESAQPNELFGVVAEEVSRVFEAPVVSVIRYEPNDTATDCASFSREGPLPASGQRWSIDGPSVIQLVRSTRDVARIDDYAGLESELADAARQNGMVSTVGAPIVVAGHVWGTLIVSSTDEPLPEGTETRLADFTELLATALAGAESREALARLVDEQAALRRVATLVAQQAPTEELFAAVVEEVGRLLPVTSAAMGRYDPDGVLTTVAAWSMGEIAFPAGQRWSPEGMNVTGLVLRTGQPARLDDFSDASGPIGVRAREIGYRCAVGSPITAEGRLWGVVTAASTAEEPLPPDTEFRLGQFTELMGTAIADAAARAEIKRLAEEQAALRRMTTLVAEAVPPDEIFSAVSEEVGQLFGSDVGSVVRFEDDGGEIVFVGVSKRVEDVIPRGTRWTHDESLATTRVFRTGRSARVDPKNWDASEGPVAAVGRRLGVVSTVGSPIIVEGRMWGAATVSGREELPPDAEERLERFAEIIATAIANADSRAARMRFAEQQEALRRIATLVAQGGRSDDILAAVTAEVSRVIGVPAVSVVRYEADGTATELASFSPQGPLFPVGRRWSLEGTNILGIVHASGEPARIDDYSNLRGEVAALVRESGLRSTVGTPIVVADRVWGAMVVSGTERLPDDTESRLAGFTGLLGTSIANAQSGSELTASRRRIVAAADDTRRRIERDLHDGTQQRLVALGLAVRAAEASLPSERDDVREELSKIAMGLADAVEDLQELSRGIHPAILSQGGLGPAIHTLALRSPVPVELDVSTEKRLPEPIEVAAYFVASEALANVSKHADASRVEISLARRNGALVLSVRDDGRGGADFGKGSGLVGLQDRVEALGGTIRIDSPRGGGTSLVVSLPVERD
jgi:PAS domain S-box-containing protein